MIYNYNRKYLKNDTRKMQNDMEIVQIMQNKLR